MIRQETVITSSISSMQLLSSSSKHLSPNLACRDYSMWGQIFEQNQSIVLYINRLTFPSFSGSNKDKGKDNLSVYAI